MPTRWQGDDDHYAGRDTPPLRAAEIVDDFDQYMGAIGLDRAWNEAEALVRERYPGKSLGLALDGPGYVAYVGGETRIVDAWSDGSDGSRPTPVSALVALAAKLREG